MRFGKILFPIGVAVALSTVATADSWAQANPRPQRPAGQQGAATTPAALPPALQAALESSNPEAVGQAISALAANNPQRAAQLVQQVAAVKPTIAGAVVNVVIRQSAQGAPTATLNNTVSVMIAAAINGVATAIQTGQVPTTNDGKAPSVEVFAQNIAVNVRQSIAVISNGNETLQQQLLASARQGVQTSALASAAAGTTGNTGGNTGTGSQQGAQNTLTALQGATGTTTTANTGTGTTTTGTTTAGTTPTGTTTAGGTQNAANNALNALNALTALESSLTSQLTAPITQTEITSFQSLLNNQPVVVTLQNTNNTTTQNTNQNTNQNTVQNTNQNTTQNNTQNTVNTPPITENPQTSNISSSR